jgi:plasmid stabilization system protein ParE
VNSVQFHPEAQAEYEAAIAWYHVRSPRAALRFEAEVERVSETISTNPEFFSRYDEQFRFALLERFPYSLVYRIEPAAIHIIAVAHSSRAPDYWRHRT